MEDYPFIRELRSPVDEFQLRPLDERCRVVQFASPLTRTDFVKTSDFMRRYPKVAFRIYGHYSGADDLSFLRYFPFIKNFQVDVYDIKSWKGLEFLPDDLEFLGLGTTKKEFSLSFLGRFSNLTDLSLDGHSKHIEVLTSLSKLRYLTLRSITLPDLSLISPLSNLRSFGLKLGGTKNLSGIESLQSLRYLELWMIKGLSDVSRIEGLTSLRYLFLQNLKHVSKIPSLCRLTHLEKVYIEALNSLRDLSSIADAPNLEELMLGNMRHLQITDLDCLRAHPTLRAASVGLCSHRRNKEATEFLGLPWVKESKPITHYVESV